MEEGRWNHSLLRVDSVSVGGAVDAIAVHGSRKESVGAMAQRRRDVILGCFLVRLLRSLGESD
jgi:hypothetical protein